MRSATDFLPAVISTLTNFATSLEPYFGSDRISRFGTSLRRGIFAPRPKVKPYFWPDRLALNRGQSPSIQRRNATKNHAALGFFAPYFERACLRSFTPAV